MSQSSVSSPFSCHSFILQSLCGYHMVNGWHVQIQRDKFHIDDYTYIWILLVFWWAHALYACPRINKLKWEKDSYIQVWKNPKSICSECALFKKIGASYSFEGGLFHFGYWFIEWVGAHELILWRKHICMKFSYIGSLRCTMIKKFVSGRYI